MQRFWAWLSPRLQGPRGAAWLAGFAALFSLPSLRLPFEMDDHWLRVNLRFGQPAWELMGGIDPSVVAQRKAEGSLAWWAHDALHVRFLRPLTSWTHYADFALWGDWPLPMHAVNVLLYAALVWVAARAYRALARATAQAGSDQLENGVLVAALAGLMFALDDAHAPSAGWISGRNTLLAALLVLVCLEAHVRAYAEAWRPGRWLGPLALGLALLSGESGLQGAAYLIAYALWLDPRDRLARWTSLAPYAIVIALWASYYATHGYGAHGSDWYRDPLSAPGSALLGALWDVPLWLGSSLVASFATPSLFADTALTHALWMVALALIAPPLLHALRSSRLARFHACGFVLCVGPLLLTRPQDRLLVCASFGAFGWIAIAFAEGDRLGRYARGATRALAGLHLGLAPLLFLAMLGQAEPIERSARALSSLLGQETAPREIVVVNLPVEPLLNYARALRESAGASLPEQTLLLYAGGSALRVTRVDERTLDLTAEQGFLVSPFERLFTTLDPARNTPPRVRRVGGTRIEVLDLDARSAPRRVRFTFDSALSDPARAFVQWRGQRPERWAPPPIGQSVALAPLSALRSLTPR